MGQGAPGDVRERAAQVPGVARDEAARAADRQGDAWNLSGAFSNVTWGALPYSDQAPFGAWGLMHFKQNDSLEPCVGGDCADYSLLDLLFYSFTDAFLATGDYRTPFHRTAQPGDITQGRFIIDRSFIPDDGDPPYVQRELAGGVLDVTSVRAVLVPEPSTWAMLTLGFGAAGAVLRRHRRHLTSAAVGRIVSA